jgi:Tfp pilus assembly protein PilO
METQRMAKEKLKLLRMSSKKSTSENEKIVRSIPELEIITILNVLEEEMVAAQVSATLLEFAAIQQDEYFTIYPFKLELNGRYQNFLIFINKIMQLPYLIVLRC